MSRRPKPSTAAADARLEIIARTGKDWHYSDQEWNAMPSWTRGDNSLKNDLLKWEMEKVANYYLQEMTSLPAWAWAEDQMSRAKKLASAADAVSEALRDSLSDRFNGCYVNVDKREAQSLLAKMSDLKRQAEHAYKALLLSPDLKHSKEKKARRLVMMCFVQFWHAFTGRRMPGRQIVKCERDVGELVDFIAAATKPFLFSVDRFHDGAPGRDAIRQELNYYRRKGFDMWDEDLWSRYDSEAPSEF